MPFILLEFCFLWKDEPLLERWGNAVAAVVDLSEWSNPFDPYYCWTYWSGLILLYSLYREFNAAYLKNWPALAVIVLFEIIGFV